MGGVESETARALDWIGGSSSVVDPMRGCMMTGALMASLAFASAAQGAVPAVFMARVPAPTEEARWYEVRAAERVGEHFATLGVPSSRRPGPGLPTLEVRCTPAKIKRARDKVKVTLRVQVEGRLRTFDVEGRASALDTLTAEVALSAGRALGIPAAARATGLAPAWRYPFSVHRFLGRAAVRMWRGEHRQAALMYGRAQELVDAVWVPEAFEGRHRAQAHLVTLVGGDPNEKRDLATSAAERAQIALGRGRTKDALSALESFLRYTPSRAQRWALPLDLDAGVLLSRRAPWGLQLPPASQSSAGPLWRLDPRTGVVARRDAGRPGLVELVQDDLVTLQGRALTRFNTSGARRWGLQLPTAAGPVGTISTSGLMGVLGENMVAWADLSIGELGQVARGVEPLAAGVGGVVVRVRAVDAGGAPDVALLRPGKKTPAWRRAVPEAAATALTRDRVVLLADAGLVLLRSHDGKPVREPIEVGAGARLLGVRGRYAALSEGPGQVALVDVLAAERTATVRGPGCALGAVPTSAGVAVLFEQGDLLFFDRDGAVLDRAWVPGRVSSIRPGSPATPGPVVVSSQGLYAFAEFDGRTRLERDVDGALAAARALLEAGNPDAALRLATDVAMKSAGCIAQAEALRAQILGAKKDPASQMAATRARARAERAKDPTAPLGGFAL